jgi:hypothetical protein
MNKNIAIATKMTIGLDNDLLMGGLSAKFLLLRH